MRMHAHMAAQRLSSSHASPLFSLPLPLRAQDCINTGHSNCVVSYFQPTSIKVIIPGVSSDAEIAPTIAAFDAEPLGLTSAFSTSLSGVLGSQDLHNTIVAGAIAFGVVWAVLLLRYHFGGALGLYLCVVFLWLLMVFFNASPSVLSEAAIMALVLNIGLAADSHILTFERSREELHLLPYGASREEAQVALNKGQRHSLVTILEASITTIIAMITLYFAGEGPISDFAYMVMLSVSAARKRADHCSKSARVRCACQSRCGPHPRRAQRTLLDLRLCRA
jgi:hypothetical protein